VLRFLLNNTLVNETGLAADLTVLDYLRGPGKLCGTKEGCASGDCGACTAVVASVVAGELQYKSINTCITLLGSLPGQQLITVEYLQDGDSLHPVQAAMVDCHGSQCGFCTPGFVMSLFAMTRHQLTDTTKIKLHIERSLGGNLCRCTGYRPIVDAATQLLGADATASDERAGETRAVSTRAASARAVSTRAADKFDQDAAVTISKLNAIESGSDASGFYRPHSIDQLCELRAQYPDAPIVAGGTDLSLEMTQRLKRFEKVICIQHLVDLVYLTADEHRYYIGPCCTIADLVDGMQHLGSDFENLLYRFGATQVRNQATVGGSIANASPIGDLAPVFIAMGATVVLQSVDGKRSMPLEDYFVGYRKTQLRDHEFVREIIVPRSLPGDGGDTKAAAAQPANTDWVLKVYKVSKRIDDDISTICASFYLRREGDRIEALRTGFGGMAAIPKRAHALEKLVRGKVIDDDLISEASAVLATEFQPISDARASAEYRLQLAANLFYRLCIETGSESIRSRIGEHV